ncbi:MAG: hypothetical protein H5T50_05480 [Nitrososphaeria archaeon]|nr:hypothetical protein [Nitrososphaeria archaeon]
MVEWDFLLEITEDLSKIGRKHRDAPRFNEVEPFKYYFTGEGKIKYEELDEYDGKFTRREILSRYLLVSVVLDQGPDMIGVRELLKRVTTALYRQEIRIFHRPVDFFKEIGISIDEILSKHDSIKRLRAEDWARENKSSPSKYNLFFAQSMRGMISTKQVLDYAIHRWGVPLCVPLLIEKDLMSCGKISSQPLVDYIESHFSAEKMARQLKNHERYGLGSAIGDKACHLFAKMYVSVLKLVKYRRNDNGWTGFSYEVPFDSNAGRVLFRTGFLLEIASLEDYEKWEVIQKKRGKGGLNYIRVTNIRGKKTTKIPSTSRFFSDYVRVVKNYLKMGQPRTIKIQRIPNLLIYELTKYGHDYSVADFDDGLMYVGTNYCFNHSDPKCKDCPLNKLCKGYNEKENLITDYRT